MASAQLQLIDTERPWKLDRRTVEIGRAGLAQARAALAAATAPAPASADDSVDEWASIEAQPPHRAAA